MALMNTVQRYGWVSIIMHWIMSVVIFGLFGLGLWMRSLDYYDAWYHKAPDLHQSIGMLMLALLLLRLLWTGINVKPAIIGAPWERIGGLVAHHLLYLLMLVIMVSGYLIPTAEGEGFDLFGWLHVPALLTLTPVQADINGAIHRVSAWSIMTLAGLHTAAALKHHLINRDETLLHMLGMKRAHH